MTGKNSLPINNNAKKHMAKAPALFIMFLITVLFGGAFLFNIKAYASKTDCPHVYDELGLFSSSEADELEELAKKAGEKRGINFIILTTNYDSGLYAGTSDPILYDTEKYSEDFYDEFYDYYGSDYADCVLFTINIVDPTDSDYRYAYISGWGEGEIKMNDERCDLLFSYCKEDLSAGNYYDASKIFVNKGTRYVAISPNINPESFFLKLWFQILAALIISLIIILIMASNSKGKMTVNGIDYLDKNNSRILGQYDRYIRTTTTRRKIESSSGGGHGGGGHSSGGHSHSGGGGHF